MRYTLLFLAVGLLTGAAVPKQDAVNKEMKTLEGAWKVISIEVAGAKIPDLKHEFFFKEHKLQFEPNLSGFDQLKRCTYTLEPTASPKSIDLLVRPRPTEREFVMKGIYQLDGDHLKICFGEPRPSDFSNAAAVAFLKREQPGARKEATPH